jgi:transposase
MNDVSKGTQSMTAGLDLGDRYSFLCLIDTESGEVAEESRLRTTPEALRRRFSSERPLRIASEAGTHSPWVSRLLEELAHEVLVANPRKMRLIYADKHKTDKLDAENLEPVWRGWIPSSFIRSSTGVRSHRRIWRSYALGRLW